MEDQRFKALVKDPRCRSIPRNVRKVKIDERFQKLLKLKQFKGNSQIDKHGRIVNFSTSEKLKELYNLKDSSEEDSSSEGTEDEHEDMEESLDDEDTGSSEDEEEAINSKDESKNFNDNSVAVKKKKEKLGKQKNKIEKLKLKKSSDLPDQKLSCLSEDIKNEMKDDEDTGSSKDEEELIDSEDESKNLKDDSVAKQKNKYEKLKSKKSGDFLDQKLSGLSKEIKSSDDEDSGSSVNKSKNLDDSVAVQKKEKQRNKTEKLKSKKPGKSPGQKLSGLSKDIESSDEEGKDISEDEKELIDSEDGKLSGSEEDGSESDDSDSESDIFADRDEFDHNWEEWHEQAPNTDQIFKRLAVCNMDWDRIRADDLFTVFNSFKPAGGSINSVKIYPSEFGLKRMEAERLNGPPELVEETLEPEIEEKLDKKRAKFHREKLREYQLKRLQYYYAVIDCDSPETADHLYVELNGKEFESSSVRFDLRFIPDDTTFDDKPVSEAYKVPDPSEYRPRYFVSTALGQAKVDLTWDETDPQRQEILERAFKEPDNIEKDIKDYLASSSGESEEEQIDDPGDKEMKLNDRISKYKALLQSLEEKGKEEEEKYDMEISWQPDLKEKTEKLVKQKLEEPQNPFDELIKKKKEERKLKKQKKSAANKDEEVSNSESDDDASADEKPLKKDNKKLDELYLISDSKKALEQANEKSSKKKKKKNKQQKKEPVKTQDFKFVEDERFSAIYTSPDFNLDPSDTHFKKTEGNLAIIQEKQRRLKNKESSIDYNRKNKKAKYW